MSIIFNMFLIQFQIVIQVHGLLIKHLDWFLDIRLTFHKNSKEMGT